MNYSYLSIYDKKYLVNFRNNFDSFIKWAVEVASNKRTKTTNQKFKPLKIDLKITPGFKALMVIIINQNSSQTINDKAPIIIIKLNWRTINTKINQKTKMGMDFNLQIIIVLNIL